MAISDKIHWRAYAICWAALRGGALEGDFVECGVERGFLSKIIVDYLGFQKIPKTFFLLDTFDGFAEKYLTENEKRKGKKLEIILTARIMNKLKTRFVTIRT